MTDNEMFQEILSAIQTTELDCSDWHVDVQKQLAKEILDQLNTALELD